MEEKILYNFQLEVIQETLRLVGNTIHSTNRDTCLARMVEQSKRFVENARKDEYKNFVSYEGFNNCKNKE